MTHGVPQGSILGPLLFLLYINDLPYASKQFKYILYADDTSLIFTFDKNINPTEVLNLELSKIISWLDCNKLSINPKKTQAIIYKNKIMQELVKIKIKNEDINFVNTLNFLGLCFNAELNWKDHINVIRKKISKSLGIINCVRNVFQLS